MKRPRIDTPWITYGLLALIVCVAVFIVKPLAERASIPEFADWQKVLIIVGIVIVSIIVYMLIENRSSTNRIIATAMSLPEPDACEHIDVPTGKVDTEVEAMRDRLYEQVGPGGRVEIQSYMRLDGTSGIIGTAYREERP